MNRLTALLFIALLAACEPYTQTVVPTRENYQFTLVVVAGTIESTASKCQQMGVNPEASRSVLQGCARFEHDTNTCTIFVVRPRDIDDPVTTLWGHELQHCVYGKYHQ